MVQSIYSAVVKDVINSITENHSGLESSVISEIQNRWMEEYAFLTGTSLNLNAEETEKIVLPAVTEQAKVCCNIEQIMFRRRKKQNAALYSQPFSLVILCL